MAEGKNNLLFMANMKENSDLWTPVQMARSFIQEEEVAEPERRHPKAVLILLDDRDHRYSTYGYYAGMKKSEIVALLEVVKSAMVNVLNGGE